MSNPDAPTPIEQAWTDILAHTGAEGYDHISADEAVAALVEAGWRRPAQQDVDRYPCCNVIVGNRHWAGCPTWEASDG